MNRVLVSAFLIACSILSEADAQLPDVEWPVYGGDGASSKYSPLDQIDASNVGLLEIAWEWVTADATTQERHPRDPQIQRADYFQCTPLMIDGVLYGSTSLGHAFSLDARTGEELWKYNTESYRAGRPPNLGYISRGVAFDETPDGPSVFMVTGDSYLWSFNAETGEPRRTFGDQGWVDLIPHSPRAIRGRGIGHPSAPAVCRGTVIVGSSITDGPARKQAALGRILGFDSDSGALRWSFNLVPQAGEYGADTWEDGAETYSGHSNVWAPISVDEELGYVYFPTSTATNDFYGGHRLGDNLFAESILCLNAETGERVWHFQTVHHGLWDYDNPCAPNLVDIAVEGREIKALAQVTKQGFTFVLDRRTGEPVWPIEERVVPRSTVPGERTSPTQPFPTKPPPFAVQGVSDDVLIDYTPELRARAKEIFENYAHGPLFTPPSADKPTLMLPGWGGGANWPGAAFDPESGMLYVPSLHHATALKLQQPDPARSDFRYTRASHQVETIDGLDLLRGPYAKVSAIDMNRGEIVWEITNGGDGPIDHPLLRDLDLPPLGTKARAAALVTKSLLFITEGSGRSGTATGGGPHLRAVDKANGAEISKFRLPGDATGVPMTYSVGGRQYVVVAVGTHPARLIALTLPSDD